MAIVRQDEILEKAISSDPSAVPRYNLRAPDGTLVGENIALELANAVTQMGTPVNAAALNEMLAASGITSGSSTAYTLAQEGFSLFDGATVRFRLHVASGVNPTLNVNGTGAKPIISALGDAMPNATIANAWVTATYSALIDAYILDGIASRITSGSFIGDGTGEYNFSLRAYGAELRGVSIASNAPREIELPFAPNVLVIYSPGNPPTSPIYQGGSINASLYGMIYAATSSSGGTSQYFNTSSYSAASSFIFPIVKLDGNKLQVYDLPSATVTQQSASHGDTYVNELDFHDISDSVIAALGGANVAGVTYNYIAF